MQAPIPDDDPPVRDPQEDAPFLTWAVAGGLLVLVYILVLIALRSA